MTPLDYQHDPLINRPEPDRELCVRAQRYMLADESEMSRFVRQHWEAAASGVRVAMDAWRTIWPIEREEFSPDGFELARKAMAAIEEAHIALNDLSEEMLGPVMHEALLGTLSKEEMDELEGADGD